jgi:prephenate dehydrogenase
MSAGPFAIIGLGCIGGSLARALTERHAGVRTWSDALVDRDLADDARVPVARSAEDAMRGAAVIVIAVPLSAIKEVAARARAVAPEAIILHTGSLQGAGVLGMSAELHAHVIGTHPLAGSHASGFGASRADLYAGCTVSIESRADARTREAAESLWRLAGAVRFDYREGGEHDLLMAWVSHLPQLAATALAGALAATGVASRDGGPGLRDSTRLAMSPLDMWEPLLSPARRELDVALAALETRIGELRRAIASRNSEQLALLWESARAWRLTAGDRP